MPANQNNISQIDSLLFTSAQLLYFDLGMKDSATVKFNEIVEKFPVARDRISEKSPILAKNADFWVVRVRHEEIHAKNARKNRKHD